MGRGPVHSGELGIKVSYIPKGHTISSWKLGKRAGAVWKYITLTSPPQHLSLYNGIVG
jgi:hypothetical protein